MADRQPRKPRDCMLVVRMTAEELDRVKALAKEYGVTVSWFVRGVLADVVMVDGG